MKIGQVVKRTLHFSSLNSAFNQYPLVFQIISTGFFMGSADVISQRVFERGRFDPVRTLRFLSLGGVFVAPVCATWYVQLEKIKFGGPKLYPLLRVFIDQALFTPVYLVCFLVLLRLVERDSFSRSVSRMRQDLLPMFIAGLKVWPAVQIVNFYFVPLHFRIIVANFVGFFWNIYVAWVTHRHQHRIAVPLSMVQTH